MDGYTEDSSTENLSQVDAAHSAPLGYSDPIIEESQVKLLFEAV
jgi:hypothetical protein